MIRLTLACGALIFAPPALAETGFACAFTVACEAAGECLPEEILTEIGVSEDGAMAFLGRNTDGLEITPMSPANAGVVSFSGLSDDQVATLITINADGTALFSQHGPEAAATTHFGTCEVM